MAKTPVVASKKSAKVAKAAAAPKKDGKKKRSTKRTESYGIYIYKVLKQVHPGKSLAAMHHCLSIRFNRIRASLFRDRHLQEGDGRDELLHQ